MVWLPALILPVLFCQQGTNAAQDLKKAGITHVAVPPADVTNWQSTGIAAEPADVASTVKLPAPGVALRVDEASATHVPWVSGNGWRFIRESGKTFYYDNPADAPLAAAEAFTFGGRALIRSGANGITALGKMLEFLRTINSDQTNSLADIGFVDDKSTLSGEVMNLMVRDNLLFNLAPSDSGGTKLTVRLGTEEYPRGTANDANSLVHKIRTNLTDAKRSVRVFGTSVIIVRLTGDADNPRLHLLNYGAPAHIRMGEFRVRVLGQFLKAQLHCFEAPGAQLADFEARAGATEFTIPSLTTYAVVDLAR